MEAIVFAQWKQQAEASKLPSWPGGVAATSRNSAKHPPGADGVVDLLQKKFFVGIRTTTPSVPSSVASQYFLSGTATPPGQEGSLLDCDVCECL